MKRGLLIYTFIIIGCLTASGKRAADTPKVTFGAEWSYIATLQTGYHYNFFAPDGYRVDMKNDRFGYFTNGEVLFHGGYNLSDFWNLSLYLGYTGVSDLHPAIPVSLRATRYFGDNPLKDRWFAFGDIGSGISIRKDPREIFTGKIGGGYRVSLSKYVKLDFVASLRSVYTHPDIIYYGEKIEREWINRDNGYLTSISLGISLTF